MVGTVYSLNSLIYIYRLVQLRQMVSQPHLFWCLLYDKIDIFVHLYSTEFGILIDNFATIFSCESQFDKQIPFQQNVSIHPQIHVQQNYRQGSVSSNILSMLSRSIFSCSVNMYILFNENKKKDSIFTKNRKKEVIFYFIYHKAARIYSNTYYYIVVQLWRLISWLLNTRVHTAIYYSNNRYYTHTYIHRYLVLLIVILQSVIMSKR